MKTGLRTCTACLTRTCFFAPSSLVTGSKGSPLRGWFIVHGWALGSGGRLGAGSCAWSASGVPASVVAAASSVASSCLALPFGAPSVCRVKVRLRATVLWCWGAWCWRAGRRLPRLLASGVRACNNLENVRCVQCARHRIAHDIPGKIVLMSYWLVLMLVHVLRTIPDGLVQMHCTPTLVLRLDHKFARTKKLKAMAPPRIASTVKASNSSFGML